jgi:hypothetical protein
LKSRVAGLGSLGHPRVLAVSAWYGSHIAREAKQLTPSAWIWARHLHSSKVLSHMLLENAVRIRDPHVHFGSQKAIPALKRDLARRKKYWLHKPAKAMLKVTLQDWKDWQHGWRKRGRTR